MKSKQSLHKINEIISFLDSQQDASSVELTREQVTSIRSALREFAAAEEDFLSTQQAAEFLGVSRPFVIKLVEQGKLPARKVGKHRRISKALLREYARKLDAAAEETMQALAAESQDLNIY